MYSPSAVRAVLQQLGDGGGFLHRTPGSETSTVPLALLGFFGVFWFVFFFLQQPRSH